MIKNLLRLSIIPLRSSEPLVEALAPATSAKYNHTTFWALFVLGQQILSQVCSLIALSAASRDLLCKKLGLLTAKVVTDPLPDLLSSQKPSRFDNRSLAVDPFRLNPVEPGTLGRQPAQDDAYTTFAGASLLQHGLIVLAYPSSDLLTHMPGGVIPNQYEHVLALHLDLFTQPLQKIGGHLADRAS